MNANPQLKPALIGLAVLLVSMSGPNVAATDVVATTHNAAEGTYGLRVTVDSQQPGYMQDDSPDGETVYRARFWFMPRQNVADAQGMTVFEGYDASNTPILRLYFICESRLSGGCARRVRALARNDANVWNNTGKLTIGSIDPWLLEIEMQSASGAGANDGCVKLRRLDGTNPGVRSVSTCGLDNDTKTIEFARLGAVNNIDPVSDGNVFFDSFESYRSKGSP